MIGRLGLPCATLHYALVAYKLKELIIIALGPFASFGGAREKADLSCWGPVTREGRLCAVSPSIASQSSQHTLRPISRCRL